jgi:hypothetical protein
LIARALVDNPEEVVLKAVEGQQVTVLELKVHPADLGKVIGRQGRTARDSEDNRSICKQHSPEFHLPSLGSTQVEFSVEIQTREFSTLRE